VEVLRMAHQRITTSAESNRGRQSPTFLVTHAKAGAGYSVIFAMAKKQMCK